MASVAKGVSHADISEKTAAQAVNAPMPNHRGEMAQFSIDIVLCVAEGANLFYRATCTQSCPHPNPQRLQQFAQTGETALPVLVKNRQDLEIEAAGKRLALRRINRDERI